MSKPFASSTDLTPKTETLEVLADGVYALTAEGDPNVGAIEGEDFVVAFEARATPAAARDWLAKLREHTDKPVRYLVLSHYHAVRVLGAEAFEADEIAFFSFFAEPIPGFEDDAIEVIATGLHEGACPRDVRRSARLLQAYELDFWQAASEPPGSPLPVVW